MGEGGRPFSRWIVFLDTPRPARSRTLRGSAEVPADVYLLRRTSHFRFNGKCREFRAKTSSENPLQRSASDETYNPMRSVTYTLVGSFNRPFVSAVRATLQIIGRILRVRESIRRASAPDVGSCIRRAISARFLDARCSTRVYIRTSARTRRYRFSRRCIRDCRVARSNYRPNCYGRAPRAACYLVTREGNARTAETETRTYCTCAFAASCARELCRS